MTDLQEKLIIQSIWLERFKGETPEIIIANLEEASKKIDRAINKNLTFEQLRKVVAEAMQDVYLDYDVLLYNDMKKIAETSYNATNTLLNSIAIANGFKEMPKFIDLPESAKKRILDKNRPILGQTLKDLKANAIFSGNKRIREAIFNGLNEDATLSQTQRKVRAIDFKDEIIGRMSRHELDTTVNTALKSAIEESRNELYNQHDDIIIGWRSLGTLDNRISNLCRSLDNEFYPKPKYTLETVPYKPPRHPNCRSILLPETEFDQLVENKRPSAYYKGKTVNHRDGTQSTKWKISDAKQVKGDKSFNDVFDNQSEAFKKDYLGAKRYELYKKDKRVLKEMYSLQRKKKLTINELKAKLNLE